MMEGARDKSLNGYDDLFQVFDFDLPDGRQFGVQQPACQPHGQDTSPIAGISASIVAQG
jgi:hypothetical protein